MSDAEVMNVGEAAAFLRLHRSTVSRLLSDGKIPRLPGDGPARFSSAGLTVWLAGIDDVPGCTYAPCRSEARRVRAPLQRQTPAVRASMRQRFRVLERCGFACVYCGRRPPEVVLHVDHVQPVAAGGRAEDANLVAACRDCNLGKSDRVLEASP